MKYEFHPIACVFPMMDDKSFEKLKTDIATNGVQQWGLLYEGKILDGRNRYRACEELGVEMTWSEIEGEEMAAFDPMQYVITHNLHRRHLKQSQRAMIAAKMATLKDGKRPSSNDEGARREDAAALLSVSTASLDRAKHVLENGSKQLIEAVEADTIKVSMAEKLCKACDDKREQTRLVKEGRKAIQEYLNPTPHDSLSDQDADDDDIEPDTEFGDKYEYPIVKMFKHADYRVNTLKVLFKELSKSELSLVKKWLQDTCQ